MRHIKVNIPFTNIYVEYFYRYYCMTIINRNALACHGEDGTSGVSVRAGNEELTIFIVRE